MHDNLRSIHGGKSSKKFQRMQNGISAEFAKRDARGAGGECAEMLDENVGQEFREM
jgi:hypothetical protein